jgi:hypothetical protein
MWCDASPSIVKIVELAGARVLLPQQCGKQLMRTLSAALCDGIAGKNTVKSSELPMFQQKQGPQAHDDSTRTGRRSPRKGQGRLAVESA